METEHTICMMRVLLVEDDRFTLNTLASALASEGFEIQAASSVSEAITKFQQAPVQALVADLDLGAGPTGIDLATLFRKSQPALGVVILTSFEDPRLHRQASRLPLGTQYLVKQSLLTTAELSLAIRSSIASAKDRKLGSAAPKSITMTNVQLETMRLVAQGLSNSEIAKQRFVSSKAIEKTIRSIADQLELAPDSTKNLRVSITRAYLKFTGGKA